MAILVRANRGGTYACAQAEGGSIHSFNRPLSHCFEGLWRFGGEED